MSRRKTSRLPEGSLIHAGAGSLLSLAWLGIIPGLIPSLALTALVTLVLVAPLLVLGLAALVIGGPPYVIWRLAARGRWTAERGQPPERQPDQRTTMRPTPIPTPHTP